MVIAQIALIALIALITLIALIALIALVALAALIKPAEVAASQGAEVVHDLGRVAIEVGAGGAEQNARLQARACLAARGGV